MNPAGPQSPLMSLIPLVAIFVVMYFLSIRPQQKKMQEHRKLLEALKIGDEVVLSSGFLGQVVELRDTIVVLEIANGVKVRVMRQQINQVNPKLQQATA